MEKENEISDMKNILKNVENPNQVLSDNQVAHFYSIMKNKPLRDELSEQKKKLMLRNCWSTLKTYMAELLLVKDFQLIYDSYLKKQEALQK